MNIGLASLRCQSARPGSLPLVICWMPLSGPPSEQALLQRLAGVADLPQLFADGGVLDHLLVGLEAGLAALERRVDRLGREHARADAVVHALQRHRVDHAAGVADEHRAGHRELGHRPVAAAGQRLGAPGDALAALEDPAHERMRLERLQQVVRGGGRVGVLELDDEADRDEVLAGLLVLHRVDPRCRRSGRTCAEIFSGHGPDRVDQPVERLGDLPDLLDARAPTPAARAPRRGRTPGSRRR